MMTEHDSSRRLDDPPTSEQEAELRARAGEVGEDVPEGMRSSEAAQRIEELRNRTD